MLINSPPRGCHMARRTPGALRASTPPTGHYAGCKWTEPPSPSALPPPPQHWMQALQVPSRALPLSPVRQHCDDIDAQLKVLLKVQA